MPVPPPVNGRMKRLRACLRRPTYLFLVAAGLRLAVMGVFLAHNPVSWGLNEPSCIAREMVLGRGFSSPFHDAVGPTAWLAPVYPSLLAALFLLLGVQTVASAWAAILANVIFSSLTAVVVLKLGREHFGEAAGLAAGWAWAVSPPLVVMPWLLWETCLSALVMSLALLLTLRLIQGSRIRQWVLCGCFWSFAALLNPALLAPLPALAMVAAWKGRCWKGPAVMMLVCVLGITPWTARNAISLHRFIPVRSNFWPEAFFGNVTFSLHPTGDSMVYQREGEIRFADDLRMRLIAYVRSNPGEFAHRTSQRVFAFWTQPVQFGPYAALLSLAAWSGVLLAWRAGRDWFCLACVLALYPVIYYVTYTFARYRHPIEPVMYVLAGYAVTELAFPGNAIRGKTRVAPHSRGG